MASIKRVYGVVAGCLGFIAVASAECSRAGCYDVYVEEIYMHAGAAGFYVQTSGNETLANCTPSSGVFLLIPASSAQPKEIYALLLAAQLTEKTVTIRVNEGTNPCTVNNARLTRQ